MTLKEKAFENIVEKGENGVNQHFLIFRPCILLDLSEVMILAMFVVF